MTGVIYRDDAQIWQKTVSKFYGVPPRAEITVRAGGTVYGEDGLPNDWVGE
jgi:hypothetical protein